MTSSAAVLVEMHEACAEHLTGSWHPERPARLGAVLHGLDRSGLGDGLVMVTPEPARRPDLERVHPAAYLDAVENFCAVGGGNLDPDTPVVAASWEAALVAAGAGLDAVARLQRGEADAAFVAVRPPGHHAEPARAMGFCLLNNVAVAAAGLAAAGERVLIADIDAHHGNGTQSAFYADGRVGYVSLHQSPFYPGTGRLDEVGTGDGWGTTLNLPVPAGTTGDVYLAALDELVVPFAERLQPTWVLISAGFDAHRADPLTDLGLSSGDYATLVRRLAALAPAGHRLAFLEGGYDLEAVTDCTAASLAALAGAAVPEEAAEPSTNGGPGRSAVTAATELHAGRASLP